MPAIETAGALTPKPTPPGWSPVRNRHREPRKTPGFQRLDWRTRRHPDWLAEGPVLSEPVSERQIPCSIGKYREFRDFAPIELPSDPQKRQRFRRPRQLIP